MNAPKFQVGQKVNVPRHSGGSAEGYVVSLLATADSYRYTVHCPQVGNPLTEAMEWWLSPLLDEAGQPTFQPLPEAQPVSLPAPQPVKLQANVRKMLAVSKQHQRLMPTRRKAVAELIRSHRKSASPIARCRISRTAQLVLRLKDHAYANYSRGWDLVVECYSDSELFHSLEWHSSPTGAIRKFSRQVSHHQSQKTEIEATVF